MIDRKVIVKIAFKNIVEELFDFMNYIILHIVFNIKYKGKIKVLKANMENLKNIYFANHMYVEFSLNLTIFRK